jgi:hypothetical protein
MRAFKALRGCGCGGGAGDELAADDGKRGVRGVANLPVYRDESHSGRQIGRDRREMPLPTKTVTYDKVALPCEEAEQQKLLSILPYVKYVASGVGGKPTVQVSGANLQILEYGRIAGDAGLSKTVSGGFPRTRVRIPPPPSPLAAGQISCRRAGS